VATWFLCRKRMWANLDIAPQQIRPAYFTALYWTQRLRSTGLCWHYPNIPLSPNIKNYEQHTWRHLGTYIWHSQATSSSNSTWTCEEQIHAEVVLYTCIQVLHSFIGRDTGYTNLLFLGYSLVAAGKNITTALFQIVPISPFIKHYSNRAM
jgi:hypothetical protein